MPRCAVICHAFSHAVYFWLIKARPAYVTFSFLRNRNRARDLENMPQLCRVLPVQYVSIDGVFFSVGSRMIRHNQE